MFLKTWKDKIVGKWTQFATSDLGQRIITRFKSFVWRYGVFLIITFLAFFIDKVLPTWNLSPEWVALIAYVVNEITKDLNNQRSVKKIN
jgi:hypothetical protein